LLHPGYGSPHGSELRLTLDIETSKTGDSHPSENNADGIEEVTTASRK
jgi:hypothetical protein